MVSNYTLNDDLCTRATTSRLHTSPIHEQKTPTTQDTPADVMSAVRRSLERSGISQSAVNIIMSAWRKSTQSQYQCHIKRWHTFCNEQNKDPYYTDEAEILEFLAAMHDQHLSYSTINIAKSAISTFAVSQEKNAPIGNSELVKGFMKGLCVESTSPQIHSDLGCKNCFKLPVFIKECK